MRIGIVLFSLLLLLAVGAGPTRAQFGDVSVSSEFVVDGNVGGGGYVEITAANNGSEPVYIVAIGDNSDINVIYTSPSLGGKWSGNIVLKGDWQADDAGFRAYPWFMPPDTSTLAWEDYFPTNFQCVAWQVREEAEALAPGAVLVSLRYLLGGGAKRARDVYGPLPYLALGTDGAVLGSGLTSITGVVPTEGASFGRVKSLFAR